MGYMIKPIKFDNISNKKYQNITRYNEYEDIILNSFIALFDVYIGEMKAYPFFVSLVNRGELGECDGHIGTIIYEGELNENGELEPKGVITLNGKTYRGKTNQLYMLPSKTPFTTFTRFAEQLSQIDISQKVFVKGTRYSNIISCDTEEEKKALDHLFNNIDTGELKTIVRGTLGWVKQTDNDRKMLQITDPQKFQAMEYLSQYHSELLRRLYSLFGFSLAQKDKQAQVNTAEVDNRALPSTIYPHIMLTTLQECIKNINDSHINDEKWVEWYIKPSPILQKVLFDVSIDNDKDGILDNVENDNFVSIDLEKDGENNVDEVK